MNLDYQTISSTKNQFSFFVMLSMASIVLGSIVSCQCRSEEKRQKSSSQTLIEAHEIFDTTNLPVLVLEEKVYNFGLAQEGDVLVNQFMLKNEGKSELYITDVRSTCACLQVTNSLPQSIAVEDSISINWEFNSEGVNGEVSKSLLLISNTIPTEHRYFIKGKIVNQ